MIKSGRISNKERFAILLELGRMAQEIYDHIVTSNPRGYRLSMLEGSLKFQPNIETFNNVYWIDTGDEKLNDIAYYFEYGTGLYNTKVRFLRNRDYIRPVNRTLMIFRKPWHGILAMRKVKGVMPVSMMTKAVKTIDNERDYLQREIREQLAA
jgi:hypothetical protein